MDTKIKLDGKSYELKFTKRGIFNIEQELGEDGSGWNGDFFRRLSFRKTAILTYGCLLHANPNITLNFVIEALPEDDLEGQDFYMDLAKKLVRAYATYKGIDPTELEETEKKIDELAESEEENG